MTETFIRTPPSIYRPEIDGLRAVSIISVLLFHLKVDFFNGGYIGVDIFFVISGYLITRNIISSAENGRFSFYQFYSRRVHRLFPALFFTILVSFFAALFFMSPEDLRGFSRTVIATLVAASNVLFWRDSHEYFSSNTDYLPLLHSWSLAVEEQFYLIWPAALVLLAGAGFRYKYQLFFSVVAAASLIACIYWLPRDASLVFYLTPFRFFEFAIGALCICAEKRRAASSLWLEPIAFVGIAAIAGSIVVITQQTPLRGLYSLIPCLGAAMVIYAGPTARVNLLLTNKVATGIGLISYSLYLCHWPIIVFARLIFGEITAPATKIYLIALSLAVATFMYFFVETPFRRPRSAATPSSSLRLAALCAVLTLCLALPAAISVRQNGWSWRLNPQQVVLWEKHRYGGAACVIEKDTECAFGELSAPLGVQIIGDSHMEDIISGFDLRARALHVRGEAFGAGGCPMLAGLTQVLPNGKINFDCRNRRDRFFNSATDHATPLIISQSWKAGAESVANDQGVRLAPQSSKDYMQVWRAALVKTIAELGTGHRRFLIVGDQITFPCRVDRREINISPVSYAAAVPCPERSASDVYTGNAELNSMLREVQRAFPNQVTLLFPEKYLCESNCINTAGGLSLYWDSSHYTVAGAEYLTSRAQDVIDRFLLPDR